MESFLDLSILEAFAYQNPFVISWIIFKSGGWIFYLFTLLWGFGQIWIKNIQDKYIASTKFVFLAIDVPKSNEQSVKAMEQFFAHLAGTLSKPNLVEKYWKGKVQLPFSLEIISLDGYIQFLVRTPANYRDLVESAIYAQYPDAEITEVADYVEAVPNLYPNEEYDLWGTQFALTNKDPYPIRTYVEFEHTLTQLFIDPMAALLEAMSKLKKGEQVWLQFLITPINDDWKEEGIKIVKKLIKAKVEEKPSLIGKIIELPLKILSGATEEILSMGGGEEVKKPELPSIMQHLSPGEKAILEAIERKTSKIGFKVKFRMIYTAKKEVFEKGRGVAAIQGAIKQFNTLNLNAFKPHKKITTKIDYFFIKRRTDIRRNKIIKAYKFRSPGRGMRPFILNIEELASIFHFPILTVKAPLLKKTESKKAEPPVSLPISEEGGEEAIRVEAEKMPQAIEELREEKTEKLPFDYDNPYFEERFALEKRKLSSAPESGATESKEEKQIIGERSIQPIKRDKPPSNLPMVE